MSQTFIRILRYVSAPIRRELPLFIFTALTLATVRGIDLYLNGRPTTHTVLGTVAGFALALLWSYLITSLSAICRKRWLKITLYVLLTIYFLINLFLFYHFSTTVSPTILTVTAETNPQEASDFLNAFLLTQNTGTALLIALGILIAAIAAEIFLPYIRRMTQHRIGVVLTTILAVSVIATGVPASCELYTPLAQCQSPDDISQWRFGTYVKPADTITDLLYSVYDIYLASDNTHKAIAATQRASQEPVSCQETDSLAIVVVIGESYIKSHCQLYGYELATTPQLKNELDSGRLYVFHDAVSPYNMTSDVIKNVFSCNSIEEHEPWYDLPAFPALFRKAGYHVSFWDNQRYFDAQKEYTFALNSFLYDDDICRTCYDETNKRTYKYDLQLVEAFQKEAHHDAPHRLDILHLMGQHFTASNRYPRSKTFSRFRSDSIRRDDAFMTRKIKYQIACYDNATYYNDFVVGKIIDFYKSQNAFILYFADHGEEIYDYRDFKGREHGDISPKALKYQFEVPFFIWVSDRYQASHAKICEDLSQAVRRPVMLDNICQTLFRVGGINTPYYHPQRDVSHQLYQPRKRLIRGQFYYEDRIGKEKK